MANLLCSLSRRLKTHPAFKRTCIVNIIVLLVLGLCPVAALAADGFVKLANPATLPGPVANGVAFSADGTYLAVASNGSPYITIYKRNSDTFTKLSNPATLPAYYGYGAAFSPDGSYLAVAHAGSPYITIYKRDGDTFTKLANPATLPITDAHGVSFSPDSNYLAVAHEQSPYITIYKRDGDSFTKLSNPATLPGGAGYGAAFSSDGTYLAVAHAGSPNITIYKRDGDTFTKLSNPATLPGGYGNGVSFSSDVTYLAVAHDSKPYVTIYKRSGDTFTKLDDPSTLPPNDGKGVSISPDGSYVAVAHGTPPNLTIYKRNSDTFTRLDDPATTPAGYSLGVAFSPDSTYMAVGHFSSPYASIYKFTAAPAVVSAATDTSGTVITITFNKNMTDPTGKQAEFSYSVNGGTAQSFSSAAPDSDNTRISLVCSGTAIKEGDSITVSYTKGTVTSADGGVLDTFSDQTVSNNIPGAPTIVSAATSVDGSLITITFSKDMADPSGKQAEFSYKANGITSQPFSSAALDSDKTKIDLVCAGTHIAFGNTVSVSYTRGSVLAADGGVLDSFTNHAVTNKVSKPNDNAVSASVKTALGAVSFTSSAGNLTNLVTTPPSAMQFSVAGFSFPFGMFSFNITGLAAGGTAKVTIKYPYPLPLGVKYLKYQNGAVVDCTALVTRVDAYTLQLNLTDGGTGDADGLANGTIVDPGGPAVPLNTTPQSSSATLPVAPQVPVALSNITVKSASLSATRVAPGEKVTITASVANTGTANGASLVKIYINGAEEASQGVSVNGGGSSSVSFDVARNEPGTYTVYVGGTNAGSFTVDEFTPGTILIISGALVFFALMGGFIWVSRRRP